MDLKSDVMRVSNLSYLFLVCLFSFLFRAIPVAYGGSPARGEIGTAAAGLC